MNALAMFYLRLTSFEFASEKFNKTILWACCRTALLEHPALKHMRTIRLYDVETKIPNQ